MTDDGFHSQTPLLFDQVGAVESVVVVVGLGQLEGSGGGAASGVVLHLLRL